MNIYNFHSRSLFIDERCDVFDHFGRNLIVWGGLMQNYINRLRFSDILSFHYSLLDIH